MAGQTGTYGAAEGIASVARHAWTSKHPTMLRIAPYLLPTTALMAAMLIIRQPSPLGAQLPSATPIVARLTGVVFDSVALRPLAGAVVQLVSRRDLARARSTETSASGAFVFDSVAAGSYVLGFYHPILDSLGIETPLDALEVRSSGELRVVMAVPSSRTVLAAFCGAGALKDSTGMLLGYVRSAIDGSTRPRAQIRATWSELTVSASGIQRTAPSVLGDANEQGGVIMCGLPRDAPVLVRAWSGRDSSGFAEFDVPASGLLLRDLYVGSSHTELVRSVALPDTGADSTGAIAAATTTVLRGTGALRGEVRRPDGTPLAGARVVFWGAGTEATTGASGSFHLRALPTGTYTLEARALGFLPQRRAVDILDGREGVVSLSMESFGTYLDTVKVTTQRVFVSRQLQEFEQRRRRGFGFFMDEESIGQRNPMYVSDLFRLTPGVTVAPGGNFGNQVLMRGSGFNSFCLPAVFIDGMRIINTQGDLDAFVNAQDIRALEVYTRASNVPPQFLTMEGCGSLVIWTGGRRARPERKD